MEAIEPGIWDEELGGYRLGSSTAWDRDIENGATVHVKVNGKIVAATAIELDFGDGFYNHFILRPHDERFIALIDGKVFKG